MTGIINPIAIANIEAALAAVPPYCVLHEPREGLWESRIELPGVNLFGDGLNNVGTAAGPIASQPIGVVRVEPMQDPGPVQKIVNEGVDGDHAAADLNPEAHSFRSTEQDA